MSVELKIDDDSKYFFITVSTQSIDKITIDKIISLIPLKKYKRGFIILKKEDHIDYLLDILITKFKSYKFYKMLDNKILVKI